MAPPPHRPRALFSVLFRLSGRPGGQFRRIFGPSVRFFAVFCSRWSFFPVFLCFGLLQGLPRTLKNHQNHCTVIKFQGFAHFYKSRSWHRFWGHLGSLLDSFWPLLASLGLSWATLGVPMAAKRPPKTEKRRSETSLAAPRVPEGCRQDPLLTQKGLRVGARAAK